MIAIENKHFECARILKEYSAYLSELANLADASSAISKLNF